MTMIPGTIPRILELVNYKKIWDINIRNCFHKQFCNHVFWLFCVHNCHFGIANKYLDTWFRFLKNGLPLWVQNTTHTHICTYMYVHKHTHKNFYIYQYFLFAIFPKIVFNAMVIIISVLCFSFIWFNQWLRITYRMLWFLDIFENNAAF